MQSHLDGSSRPGSFSAMLSSGTDPCFGGGDHHHDFPTLNGSGNSNGQNEFGHLMNTNQQHHHHHHSHHSETNNNNTNTANHNSSTNTTTKPKKVPPPNGKKTKGRVKIKMEFIDNKLRRYTTFSKRKTGIMKKAYELSTLTGTQVMLLVASETGHVYTFATRKLQPMITSEAGKALIQTCLNSPDPPNSGDAQRMSATGYEETELTYATDPNGSDHGDTKEDESESGSSDGDEGPTEAPPMLPLTHGLLPPNFAALFASSTAAGFSGAKSGLSLGLVPSSQDGPTLGSGGLSNRSGTYHGTREPPPPSSSLSSSSSTPSSSATTTTTTMSSTSTAQLTSVSPKSIRIKKEVPN